MNLKGELEGEDFLQLIYQSSETRKLLMISIYPNPKGSLEENAKNFIQLFLQNGKQFSNANRKGSPPVISNPTSAYLDGNPAIRYEMEHGDDVHVRKGLVIFSVSHDLFYIVYLSPQRGEPMADKALRAIGASIKIEPPKRKSD